MGYSTYCVFDICKHNRTFIKIISKSSNKSMYGRNPMIIMLNHRIQ